MTNIGAAFTVRFLRNGDTITITRDIVKSSGAGAALFQMVDVTSGAVAPDFNDYAQKVYEELKAVGIKVNAYLEDENMKNKIKDISTAHRTPYILVVGEKEKAENTVTCRFRFSSKIPQRTFALGEFKEYVLDKINTHFNGI